MALDSAEGAALPRPDDAGPEAPHVEIEFEVVSVFRPRRIRLAAGAGDPAARMVRIAHEADADAPPAGDRQEGGDDPHTSVILWAYYEACRSGAEDGGRYLPWEHPRNRRAWRSFREAMLAQPDRDHWWTDPAKLLERARGAYRKCHHGFGD